MGGEDGSARHSYPPGPAEVRDYRMWVDRLVNRALKLGVSPTREALAEAAGYDGATLSNVMGRRRHLSEEIIRRLSAALGLDKLWTTWLLWWMTAQRAPSTLLRKRALAEKHAIEPSLRPLRPPRPGGDGFRGTYVALPHPLSTWLGRVLFAMAQLPDFDPTPARVYSALRGLATPRAIGDTLRTLVECGALVSGPEGRPLTQAQHLIPTSPASAQPSVEAINRTRQALLLWSEGAHASVRVGYVPESRLIPWGWDLIREDRERAIAQEEAVGTVRAGHPEADPDLPRADMVAQSITLALILRRPGEPAVELPPEPPGPLHLPWTEPEGRDPSLFGYTHPEAWIRAALAANRGTDRVRTQREVIRAGISKARMRHMMHPELGRHLPLDEADQGVLGRLFRLSAPAQRLLRRMVQFHQARGMVQRRALLDQLVGLVEAEHNRLDTGSSLRCSDRLEHLLVRGLMARGLTRAEPIAEVLGWPRERIWPILKDIRKAGLAAGPPEFLALPAPRAGFGSLRLTDELLQWAAQQLEAGQDRQFLRVLHNPTQSDRLSSLWAAQQTHLDHHAVLALGPGPWVPVVLVTAIHRVSRCLSRS